MNLHGYFPCITTYLTSLGLCACRFLRWCKQTVRSPLSAANWGPRKNIECLCNHKCLSNGAYLCIFVPTLSASLFITWTCIMIVWDQCFLCMPVSWFQLCLCLQHELDTFLALTFTLTFLLSYLYLHIFTFLLVTFFTWKVGIIFFSNILLLKLYARCFQLPTADQEKRWMRVWLIFSASSASVCLALNCLSLIKSLISF